MGLILMNILLNPFQFNDKDYYTQLSQIDPDVNFYNDINSHLGLYCKYYIENSFYNLINAQMNRLTSENLFSLCHINIRSLRANLSSLELTLNKLRIHFTAGVSETWLTDHNCDLYNIEGYNLIETHRQLQWGGGVRIFLDNKIPYHIRPDIVLSDGISERIFVEIDKDTFQRCKNIILGVIYRPPSTDLPSF